MNRQSGAALQRPRSVSLTSWGWTQRGDRKGENQDSFLNWPEIKLWSVADGVGGSEHGAAASRYVIKSLMSLKEQDSLTQYMTETKIVLREANDFLYGQRTINGSAASTVVALLMHEGEAACVWAGDSRCYLMRSDVLYQCTHDHTLRQKKIDTGELTVPEAYRMVKGNIITSAVGVADNIRIDAVRFKIRAGDKFLLCSDGLSNLLDGSTLQRMLAKNTPQDCAEAIIHSIKGMPQPDNITFVVVFISSYLKV